MLKKLKGMADKATETVKGFDYNEAVKSGKKSLSEWRERAETLSSESVEKVKNRMYREGIKDEAAYNDGFFVGQRTVLSDMEEGKAQPPSHYVKNAEKSFRGDYRKGYIAGVDAAFGDL